VKTEKEKWLKSIGNFKILSAWGFRSFLNVVAFLLPSYAGKSAFEEKELTRK
jgi:hypothetical protein